MTERKTENCHENFLKNPLTNNGKQKLSKNISQKITQKSIQNFAKNSHFLRKSCIIIKIIFTYGINTFSQFCACNGTRNAHRNRKRYFF